MKKFKLISGEIFKSCESGKIGRIRSRSEIREMIEKMLSLIGKSYVRIETSRDQGVYHAAVVSALIWVLEEQDKLKEWKNERI